MAYIVMNNWNVIVTVLTDLTKAKAAARACNGYIVIRNHHLRAV